MNFKIYLFLLVLFSALLSACTMGQASTGRRQEIVIADEIQQSNPDEIIITENDIKAVSPQNSSNGNTSQEQTVTTDSDSKTTTTVDSYGNKTETRCFTNHPRLDCVMVTTSAGGKKEILIYPVGSGAKKLSENAAEQALTASPDELASLAGAYETRADVAKKSISPYNGKNDFSGALRPLPSSAFPAFPNQIPQTVVEQVEDEPAVKNTSESPKPEFENEK